MKADSDNFNFDSDKMAAMSEDGQNKEVDIVIEVSNDGYEAYATLVPLTESPKFTVSDVIDALSDKGIKFGIDDLDFVSLNEEPKYNEKILIASGIRPQKGRHGKINYFVNSTETVKKGDKIGEIVPPEQGIDGITVFGEEIPVKNARKAKIPSFINVEFPPRAR